MTPAEKIKYARAMREQNCIALDDWHPWFAWYPVKQMPVGPCIWLRRCWRRRLGASRDPITMYEHYEYRRWKRGNKRK